MAKLEQPINYQGKLEGLAETFPLDLRDESRQVVTLPVCDKQPADSAPPAVGRFLQCTEQGAMLAANKNGFDNVDIVISRKIGPNEWETSYTFAQKVYHVTCYWYERHVAENDLYWASEDGSKILSMVYGGFTHFRFTGTTIYFRQTWYPDTVWFILEALY